MFTYIREVHASLFYYIIPLPYFFFCYYLFYESLSMLCQFISHVLLFHISILFLKHRTLAINSIKHISSVAILGRVTSSVQYIIVFTK